MIEVALELKEPLTRAIAKNTELRKDALNEQEWQQLAETKSFLAVR